MIIHNKAISRESCKHEDQFFQEKYHMSAYDWRLQHFEYNENIWFRNTMSMSAIDTSAKSKALIDGHENLSGEPKSHTKRTKRPPIPININDVVQFPYKEVFFRQIPYRTKYKGVHNIIFMPGQSQPYIVDWFKKLTKDEKYKLNNILAMIDEKIDIIRGQKRPFYALCEVLIIGYCIKCLFYDEDIDVEKLAQPKDICTKEVRKFVDVFSKCYTMRYKSAAYVKDPKHTPIGMVPCKNVRNRYDQRYFLDIYGCISKKNWKWITD